jgi:hypothetical protein
VANDEGLLSHQWRIYCLYHRSLRNLLVHIAAVPLFLAGNVVLVLAVCRVSWIGMAIGIAAMGISLVAQGRGHRVEQLAAEPFSGPVNAVARLFAEQWITFPRFVLTGKWLRAVRDAK